MYNNIQSYQLMLLESDVFDKQILEPMYEDIRGQFPDEAEEIVEEYNKKKILRPEAYCRMKELLEKRTLD